MTSIISNSITFVDNTGVEKYLYIRYSNDGKTFTENNGTIPGSWLGTCTSNSVVAPTEFDSYQWSRIGSYFHVKYSNDGQTFTDNNGEDIGDWMGTCTTDSEEDPIDFNAYTWKKIAGSAGRGISSITEYYLLSSEKEGVKRNDEGWTTDILSLSKENKYLWNYEKTEFTNGDIDESEPMIIGVYGDGVQEIINYYAVTSSMNVEILDEDWHEGYPPGISATNKYLWNKEVIKYTDGKKTETVPAIIGIHGDSGANGENGANAITFDIYSHKGFMFKENLKEITLQIGAFEGSEKITDATFTWEWWNDAENKYSTIKTNTTEKSLVVTESDVYAYAHLKCTMVYKGKLYEDYITLTSETVIFTSVVKFFEGRNVFYADDPYLVAYVELYQNNHKIETIFANQYCSGISSVSNGIITAAINGSYSDGDRMYFVCENANGLYDVILGEYVSNTWKQLNFVTEYTYTNSLYPTIKSNVIAISKESINKAANIDFIVSKNNIDISETNVNIIDSNDPIVGGSAPENPVEGQLWLDTSASPYILKIYTNGDWEKCMEKIGGAIFTVQPTSYSEGDLWILAEGEKCGDFGPGSMLKAIETAISSTVNASHWIDADEESTALKNNIKQYLKFDTNTGLTIGQTNNAGIKEFYVNITSKEMGFYDNSKSQNQKVVNISNNSATIQSAKLKGNTEFYGQINICDPKSNPDDNVDDTLFVWKIESNGSLSLVIS